ncbi:MAG TPA: PDZ domain-containing protein, partial [Herpetosiphonaceae bacterium]|nr:PDZ domain-containing protein [Herpetosiphonaceae bacterium]
RGQVIGVNTFILDPSGRGANIGIGYAVPINLVKRIAPSLRDNGSYTHPYLGFADLRTVNSLFARQNNLPSKGVYINEVVPNGPAGQAGVQAGETIVAIDGQAILEAGQLVSYLEFNTSPGDSITLTLMDGGGQTRDVNVQVAERPR